MQNALVTGTSKGLGFELAKDLLIRGFGVYGVSRSDSSIEHEHYHHLVADVTKNDYRQLLKEFADNNNIRHIDILINNAGTGGLGSSIRDIELNDVRAQFELHCVGVLSTIQVLLPILGKSKIVNITSRLGSIDFNLRGDFAGRHFSYSYRIAKGAQNMLSLCLAGDERLSDHLVISIIPGLLRTDSGADDAIYSAAEGSKAVLERILTVNANGIYHAFVDEAAY